MHQENADIIRRTHIQSDVLIVNQCEREDYIEYIDGNNRVRMFSTTERGLSRSRNMAIRNATGDICLICDDDEVLVNNYPELILKAFHENKDADIIAFDLQNPLRSFPKKKKKIGYVDTLRFSSCQLVFRRESVIDKQIKFDETMGAGVTMGGGEDNKFLLDCLRNKLSIVYVPVCIGSVSQEISTWSLSPSNAVAYFRDRGEAYGKIMGKCLGAMYIVYSSLRKYRYYTKYSSWLGAIKQQFIGLYRMHSTVSMARKTALISSLNFRPAHVSHLIASYKQFEDLGYESMLYVHPDFIPFLPINVRYCTSLNKKASYSVALFWFPCLKNIWEIFRLRYIYHTTVLYVIHEPLEKYSVYRKSGNSRFQIVKIYLKNYASVIMAMLSHKILLPSKRAVELYETNHYNRINSDYHYFPLIFDDEYVPSSDSRKYFSYIGNISTDHAFENYVDCISYFTEKGLFEGKLDFLIASKRSVIITPKVEKLLLSGRLTIVDGKPMSNEEINGYYRQSFVVWNAYSRSTQSGVLVKSLMFGTPAIIMQCYQSEYVRNNIGVVAISDNADYEEIRDAVNSILNNFQEYSAEARTIFESRFFYKNFNQQFATILNKE